MLNALTTTSGRFMGESDAAFRAKCRQHFETVKVLKPDASRKESKEYYIALLHKKVANSGA
jgi:23S rRNA U2552 (ribose-2'-O)-methylase RlmE/FtsJ